jgi:hypothetical protein
LYERQEDYELERDQFCDWLVVLEVFLELLVKAK